MSLVINHRTLEPAPTSTAPSETSTTSTTGSAAKARTRTQSATCVSSASHTTAAHHTARGSHAARVSTTDHASTARHWWLSLATSATAHESGHETTAAAAAVGHTGVDALLVALLVVLVAFAGAEAHDCLLCCMRVLSSLMLGL